MQSIKLVMRQVGKTNPELDIVSASEATDFIEYQYGSQGYVLSASHYLGEVKDGQGLVLGYKMMFVLTKDEEPKAAKESRAK